MDGIKFNMNDSIRVKLTPKGWNHLLNRNFKYFPHHLYPATEMSNSGKPISNGSNEYYEYMHKKYQFDDYTITIKMNEFAFEFGSSFISVNIPDALLVADMNILILNK